MQVGIVMSTHPLFEIMWSTPHVPPLSPSSKTLNHFRPVGLADAALSILALCCCQWTLKDVRLYRVEPWV